MATATIVSPNITTPQLVGKCDPSKKLWWVFFLSSVFTLIGGLLLVLFGKMVVAINKKISHRNSNSAKKEVKLNQDNGLGPNQQSKEKEVEKQGSDIGWITSAKDWAGELISGQTTSGRILVSENKLKYFNNSGGFPVSS